MLDAIAIGRIMGTNEAYKLGLLDEVQTLKQLDFILAQHQLAVDKELNCMQAVFARNPVLAIG